MTGLSAMIASAIAEAVNNPAAIQLGIQRSPIHALKKAPTIANRVSDA
jgi:hypothetical protein